MNKTERDCLSKRVVNFYNINGCYSSITYKHFLEEGVSRSTITRSLTRLRETGTPITKSPRGRPMKHRTVKAVKKIKTLMKRNPCISLKKGSVKMKLPKTTYRRIINIKDI